MFEFGRVLASVAAATVIVAIAAGTVTASAPTSPLAQLAGRWAGPGVVVPYSGRSENFKCVVTYFSGSDGTKVRQNLRCRNENYRLDAATHLVILGSEVRGHWRENTHSLEGTVAGIVTADGFDVVLAGRFFQARMAVAGVDCQQSVKVVPARADQFREIVASLKRC
ncbi:MAG: hypothetical protein AB7O43_17025 [Hyphomicrobiaceae bacterium]